MKKWSSQGFWDAAEFVLSCCQFTQFFVCVCVCMCIHVCVCACVCVCVHVHVFACVSVCLCVWVCECACVGVSVHVCVWVCMCVCVCVHVCMCVCVQFSYFYKTTGDFLICHLADYCFALQNFTVCLFSWTWWSTSLICNIPVIHISGSTLRAGFHGHDWQPLQPGCSV